MFASLLWFVSWPILYYFKLGEITGPKAWFWIVGALNYPVAAVVYLFVDNILKSLGTKAWLVFVLAVMLIAIAMPFYYDRYGFALGITLEARYF